MGHEPKIETKSFGFTKSIPEIKASIQVDVNRRKGNVETYNLPFESFTKNFPSFLRLFMGVDTDITAIRGVNPYSGVAASLAYISYVASTGLTPEANDFELLVTAPAASRYGLVVGANDSGSGFISSIPTDVVSHNDWALRRIIPKATSASDTALNYGAVSIIHGDNYLKIKRNFTFDPSTSGTTMTIRELGLIGLFEVATGSKRYSLIARDIRGSNGSPFSLTLYEDEVATVTYSFEVPVTGNGFTGNFLHFLGMIFGDTTKGLVNDAGATNTTQTDFNIEAAIDVMAASANSNYGILVGYDHNNSVSHPGMYNLVNKISHGITDGTLSYGAVTGGTHLLKNENGVYYSQFYLEREITNSSDIALPINEIGLYCQAGDDKYYMLSRELRNSVTIEPGDSRIFRIYLKFGVDFTLSENAG